MWMIGIHEMTEASFLDRMKKVAGTPEEFHAAPGLTDALFAAAGVWSQSGDADVPMVPTRPIVPSVPTPPSTPLSPGGKKPYLNC